MAAVCLIQSVKKSSCSKLNAVFLPTLSHAYRQCTKYNTLSLQPAAKETYTNDTNLERKLIIGPGLALFFLLLLHNVGVILIIGLQPNLFFSLGWRLTSDAFGFS